MKQTLITEHLSMLGLLEHGDPAAIAEAKKSFWAARRKEFRAMSRKKHKSIQVFFHPEEFKHIIVSAERLSISKAAFVKEAAIHAVNNSNNLYITKLLNLRKLTFEVIIIVENLNNLVGIDDELLVKFQKALSEFIITTKGYDH